MSNTATVTLDVSAEQILKNATEDVRVALPDEAARAQAARALSAALNDPEVKKKAYEDIRELAAKVLSVNNSMIAVAGDLVGFDNAKFKDVNGNVIILRPKWQPYIEASAVFCLKCLTCSPVACTDV